MSTERRLRAGYTPVRRSPDGKPLCRRCGGVVKPPKRSFCSDTCVHEWRLRSDIGYVRSHVERRDHSVCVECGRDCAAMMAAFYRWLDGRDLPDTVRGNWYTSPVRHLRYLAQHDWLAFHGIPRGRVHSDWWDADHIVPVVEGGGPCGLENYRTLCIPCHRIATKNLARFRADRRMLRSLSYGQEFDLSQDLTPPWRQS